MRFTPYSFLGGEASTTASFTITNAISGTFTSGSDTYGYLKFTGSGQLNINTGALPFANIFLVGGGSGGRTNEVGVINGHGGGGGGLLFTSSVTLNAGLYTINVGTGSGSDADGGSSSISNQARGINIGVDGGKFDGTSGFPSYNVRGAYGQGAAGGGGGLGSAGLDGSSGVSYIGGNGGTGLSYNVLGSSSFWGAGGGGGACKSDVEEIGTGGFGGSGIGGRGMGGTGSPGSDPPGNASTPGVPNTGAGGGGEADNSGLSRIGGSGIVIITYKL
jgi:hypothetical protein